MLKCQLITQAKENLSLYAKTKGRTQCRELPLCAGSGKGCQWQALPSPVQCEETVTQTRDLPVTSGKTLPLALGPPFSICKNKIKKIKVVYVCWTSVLQSILAEKLLCHRIKSQHTAFQDKYINYQDPKRTNRSDGPCFHNFTGLPYLTS